MSANTTTPVGTRHWPLTHYLALAAVVLTITIGVFIVYTLTGSGSTATDTNGSVDVAPDPFKGGFVPAQPM